MLRDGLASGKECVICFLPLCSAQDTRACKCSSGRYHTKCILEWLVKYKSSCPLCLRNGKEINMRAKDYKHLNLDKELVSAVKAQRSAFVELLLGLSANPNQTCEGRLSLLELSFLEEQEMGSREKLMVSRALLKDPRTKRAKALEFVVENCNDVECVDLLVSFGSSVHTRDGAGRTALHRAVDRAHAHALGLQRSFPVCDRPAAVSARFVAKLLEHGADVNCTDKQGQTPLMLALDHLEVVQLLIKHGAEVNAQDASGATALAHATNGLVRELLIKHGAVSKARSKSKSKLRRISFRVKRSGLGLDRFQLPKLRKHKHS